MEEMIVDGYFAYVLDEGSRARLLEYVPPIHPKVFAHHVTVVYKPTQIRYDSLISHVDQVVDIEVCGVASDSKAQAVIVTGELLTSKTHHITISTRDTPPAYSSRLVEKGWQKISTPFSVSAKLVFIKH